MCLRRPVRVKARRVAAFWDRQIDTVSAAAGLGFLCRSPRGRCSRTRPHLCLRRQTSSFSKSIVMPRTPQDPQSQAALGKAIRQLRNKQGKSQATLAAEAGITPNMLSLIERGEANPSWATVQRIAKALEISVAEIARAAEGKR